MDYNNIYNQLVHKALEDNRSKSSNQYYEAHHIIPRCVGGTNRKNNLVLLTAKEHYLAHRLLCKIYPNEPKLIYAFWMMCSMNNNNHKRFVPSSRAYMEAKELMATVARHKQIGVGFKPCIIDGVYYNGVREAADELGINAHTLRNRLKSKNPTCYYLESGQKVEAGYKGRPKAIQVEIDGIQYPSIHAAAKALNTSGPALRYRLRVDGKSNKFQHIKQI